MTAASSNDLDYCVSFYANSLVANRTQTSHSLKDLLQASAFSLKEFLLEQTVLKVQFVVCGQNSKVAAASYH